MSSSPWVQASSVEHYRGYLLALARAGQRRLLKSKIDPSDMVQTVLLQAYNKREQFRGRTEAEFLAWLRAILANQFAGVARRFSRLRRDAALEQSIHQAMGDSDSRVTMWLGSLDPSPSQAAIRADRVVEMANALLELPPDQRRAIELHHLQECSLTETADELGRSREAVAGLLYRALQQLRRRLETADGA